MSNVTGQSSILLVGDTTDESLQHCVNTLRDAGLALSAVPDVYAAMARLARGPELRHVLVDVRALDRDEAAFMSLAPRYYPSVEFAAILLEGASERLQSLGFPCACTTPQAFIARAMLISQSTHTPSSAREALPTAPISDRIPSTVEDTAEPWPEADRNDGGRQPPPQATLSTDGGPEAAPAGPSLHDAVRARMQGIAAATDAAIDPRRIRRRPPSATSPRSENASPSSRAALSAEELDALLSPNPTLEENPPRSTEDEEADGK